jgi:hypothetical protein
LRSPFYSLLFELYIDERCQWFARKEQQREEDRTDKPTAAGDSRRRPVSVPITSTAPSTAARRQYAARCRTLQDKTGRILGESVGECVSRHGEVHHQHLEVRARGDRGEARVVRQRDGVDRSDPLSAPKPFERTAGLRFRPVALNGGGRPGSERHALPCRLGPEKARLTGPNGDHKTNADARRPSDGIAKRSMSQTVAPAAPCTIRGKC